MDKSLQTSIVTAELIAPGAITQRHLYPGNSNAGDLYYGNDGVRFSELPIGATGALLWVKNGVPAWFPPGTNGQYLQISGGIPAWGGTPVATLISNRQGGSATDWNTTGTTNYVPSSPKIQVGSIAITPATSQTTGGVSYFFGTATITFPSAFTNIPLVLTNFLGDSTSLEVFSNPSTVSATQVVINAYTSRTDLTAIACGIGWIAIGT